MGYMGPIKQSDASVLINQYSTAIANLKTNPKTKDCPWVNSVISEYKGYISQLQKNSVSDDEFRRLYPKNNNVNKFNLIV